MFQNDILVPYIVSDYKQTLRANLFKDSNYYLLGSRKCNIIHTRLRHQCSSLGADLSRANITNNRKCLCGCPSEDVIHYLLECPIYLIKRNGGEKGVKGLRANV
jgi:hypothetical protein